MSIKIVDVDGRDYAIIPLDLVRERLGNDKGKLIGLLLRSGLVTPQDLMRFSATLKGSE